MQTPPKDLLVRPPWTRWGERCLRHAKEPTTFSHSPAMLWLGDPRGVKAFGKNPAGHHQQVQPAPRVWEHEPGDAPLLCQARRKENVKQFGSY